MAFAPRVLSEVIIVPGGPRVLRCPGGHFLRNLRTPLQQWREERQPGPSRIRDRMRVCAYGLSFYQLVPIHGPCMEQNAVTLGMGSL